MTGPRQTSDEDTARVFAAVGATPTDEGRARARAKLADADARNTPGRLDQIRAELHRYADGS